MKKIINIFTLFFVLLVLVGCGNDNNIDNNNESNIDDETVVILYENDVHCEVNGYSKLSALKSKLKEENDYVGVVSVGDYVQGGSLGVISQGEYIVNLINKVGYDALTLGNHEFDYKLDRLNELIGMMNTKPICCNFNKIGEEAYFKPYSIVSYGDVDVAYIGVTTPETLTSTTSTQFKDENGNFVYTFNYNNICDVVQKNVDEVLEKGADYVIALTHVGYEPDFDIFDITDLIGNTSGIDVVLDGHSHSVIENMTVINKEGEEVILTSTGTKFQNIGKLTIENNTITTELIKTEKLYETDENIDAYIELINEEYKEIGNRIIGETLQDLLFKDADGNRLVRKEETNLGDFCADAYYNVTGADIAYVNGGGIRASINKGNVTFNDLLNVNPYNNSALVCKLTGQKVKDFLETSLRFYPLEDGSFPHVAGITFTVDTTIPSSVVVDENGLFISVNGEYRVRDIKVFNRETNEYEDLDLQKEYTFASHNYFIIDLGGGMTMFKDAEIVKDYGILDVEILELYITEYLNGVIGEDYSEVKPNITFIKKDE